MEDHRHSVLGEREGMAIAAKGTFFGHPHGPFPRLYSELIDYPADSYSYDWKTFIQHADDELLEDILSALRKGSERRNLLLVTAICGGYDGMGRLLGSGKRLKRTARRFAYHVIDTIDMLCLVAGVNDLPADSAFLRKSSWLIGYVRESYSWLTPPSKSRPDGPLTDKETLLANAFVVTKGIGRDGSLEPGVRFLADNFDEMEPYFKTIHSYSEVTVAHLQALLATKPILALSSGAL